MIKNIAHIGIAVKDIESSIALFTSLLGRGPEHREEVKDQKVLTTMFAGGESSIELLQATSEESAIAKFIEKRGEGIHHISFFVDDIRAELKRMDGPTSAKVKSIETGNRNGGQVRNTFLFCFKS